MLPRASAQALAVPRSVQMEILRSSMGRPMSIRALRSLNASSKSSNVPFVWFAPAAAAARRWRDTAVLEAIAPKPPSPCLTRRVCPTPLATSIVAVLSAECGGGESGGGVLRWKPRLARPVPRARCPLLSLMWRRLLPGLCRSLRVLGPHQVHGQAGGCH